jgi:hypothetical protein
LAAKPDEVWVVGITHIPTDEGWLGVESIAPLSNAVLEVCLD